MLPNLHFLFLRSVWIRNHNIVKMDKVRQERLKAKAEEEASSERKSEAIVDRQPTDKSLPWKSSFKYLFMCDSQ
jgi:hypothetical protein